MAKKMPKGYSIKTIPKEANLVTTYGWKIIKDDKVIKESITSIHIDSIDARAEAVRRMWDIIQNT